MKNIDDRWVQRLICICQITYILLYLTNVIGIITSLNVYTGFSVCVSINTVTVILNIYYIIKSLKDKIGIKLSLIFITLLQILFTSFIYLLPEAGIDPLIKLWQ
ncbi:hypothetical protein EAI30_10915 [Romboutsia ilealis]|uniref:Uncharacterized protein n=1 Tax=Romboutsia faecis TaxID=2764597 RepID=A0ABR7JMR1_9FIRM|nr:hypothetical protein [Romboutsia faecis]MBC5996229.1 hypothetical protein [Romboutsia faecis]MRN25128.1 hypothetical protein [Romboutsia ilealis]